jgi:hypothetical protein
MLAPLIIAGTLTGCWGTGFSYEQHLTGDYKLVAVDDKEQMALVEGSVGVIAETVFAAGWTKDFIIVKQHPNNDRAKTNYFIVETAAKRVSAPLSREGFNSERKRIGVPENLEFTVVFKQLE